MKKFAFILSMLVVSMLISAQVIHVPDDHTSIQEAINMAAEGDTVLVADGTYVENINFLGKAITVGSHFLMDGDTAHISRTIIDGSQPEHDTAGSVVTMMLAIDTTSVLCGFTIQGGTGTGPFMNYIVIPAVSQYGGGGITMAGGKIIHNIIRNNHIIHTGMAAGGGISSGQLYFLETNHEVNQVIRNNRIYHNSVHSTGDYTGGAGIGSEITSGITVIEGNVVNDNTSSTDVEYKAMSGGITITRATLNNKATAIIRNNHIYNNEALSKESFGAGLFYLLYKTGTADEFIPSHIYNNIIESNYSTMAGGGICTWYLDRQFKQAPIDPVIMNNTIVNNVAQIGVGLTSIQSNVVLMNNIFQNKLEAGGTEIFDTFWRSPNYDVSVNTAITHAVFNNIQGGFPGIGNINQDPMLNPEFFSPEANSPCIGRATDSVLIAGTWYYAPEMDFEGLDRSMASMDMELDLGALESLYERPKAGLDSGQVINVPGERSSIQAAIDIAEKGDTILVEEGVYYENINFKGKAITVGSKYILDMNESHIAQTVIDGSQSANPDTASVVSLWSGEDTTSVLVGFTITGGKGTFQIVDGYRDYYGGGILIEGSGGKILNNIIEENHVSVASNDNLVYGGGIGGDVFGNHSLIVRDNLIRKNSVSGNWVYGAGIFITGGRIIIEGNTISENIMFGRGAVAGGGIFWGSYGLWGIIQEVHIRNNTIDSNNGKIGTAWSGGGGIYTGLTFKSGIHIYNNLISRNSVGGKGGGIFNWANDMIVYNNTIIDNEAKNGGNAIHFMSGKSSIFNNILYSRVNTSKPDISFDQELDDEQIISNNLLREPFTADDPVSGLHNTFIEPAFEGDSYLLSENSPAIGRGLDSLEINGVWYTAPRKDLYQSMRPNSIDPFIDLGAVESGFSRSLFSNADLASIDMPGTTLNPPFSSDKLKYILLMPESLDITDLHAIAEDALAEVDFDHAADILSDSPDDRITTITVTSSDGTFQKIYEVEIKPVSADASLNALSLSQGSLDPAFDPEIFTYEVLLPTGTSEVPTISYLRSNENSTVEVIDVTNLTHTNKAYRTAHVKVTAQDGITKVTYKIVFTVEGVGIGGLNNSNGLKLFPNPFSTTATLEWSPDRIAKRIELVNILGELVWVKEGIDGSTLTLNRGNLASGLYFIKVYEDKTDLIKVMIE